MRFKSTKNSLFLLFGDSKFLPGGFFRILLRIRFFNKPACLSTPPGCPHLWHLFPSILFISLYNIVFKKEMIPLVRKHLFLCDSIGCRKLPLAPRTPGNQSRRFPPSEDPTGSPSATGASGQLPAPIIKITYL